jgi:hypothetical protein
LLFKKWKKKIYYYCKYNCNYRVIIMFLFKYIFYIIWQNDIWISVWNIFINFTEIYIRNDTLTILQCSISFMGFIYLFWYINLLFFRSITSKWWRYLSFRINKQMVDYLCICTIVYKYNNTFKYVYSIERRFYIIFDLKKWFFSLTLIM